MDDIWVQTISGMDVDLLAPKPEQILLHDIAWSLARLARFNGHTIGDVPWNVAQHSLLVESLMPEGASPADRLVAMLHDAHEAYVGDLITPVKWALDAAARTEDRSNNVRYYGEPSVYWNVIVNRLDKVIHFAFGLSPTPVALEQVKAADLLALRVEKELLMAASRREWSRLPPMPDPPPHMRPAHPPKRAMECFLDRFDRLQRERHGLSP